jgi:hypothetical protein
MDENLRNRNKIYILSFMGYKEYDHLGSYAV